MIIKDCNFESEDEIIITFYYIITNEIPSELSCKNVISSHVKITCYLHV